MKRYVMVAVAALLLWSAVGAIQSAPVYAQDCQAGVNLNGNNLPNVLNGGPLDNVIRGFGGNDTLRGFGCNDHLFGGAGDDMLDGGAGFEWCDGGPGVDVIVNCEVVVP